MHGGDLPILEQVIQLENSCSPGHLVSIGTWIFHVVLPVCSRFVIQFRRPSSIMVRLWSERT